MPSSRATSSEVQWRIAPYLLPMVMVAAGLLTFGNSLDGVFIHDDADAVVGNRTIRTLWPPWRVLATPVETPVAARPVVNLSLAINYAAGGLNPRGYHVFNLLVHLLNGLVVFGIIRRTLLSERLSDRFAKASRGLAFGCALLWVVHPLQTECVNYITQRTESLMALFFMLTLYCGIRAYAPDHRRWWTFAAVASCALGMGSKEVMVTAPLVVILYDWSFTREPFRAVFRRRVPLYAGLCSTWLVLVIVLRHDPRPETVGFSQGVSAFQYALNQCVMIVRYLGVAFWPQHLLLDYGVPRPLTLGEVPGYALVIMTLLLTTLVAVIKRTPAGFVGACFFLILAPTSSFLPIVTEVGADRRMYLPLAALIALVVCGGYVMLHKMAGRASTPTTPFLERLRGIGWVVIVLIALGFMGRSIQRNRDYRSVVSVWESVVRSSPDNWRAHNNLGGAYYARTSVDEAIGHYRQALELKPNYAEAHSNLAAAYIAQGEYEQARHHLDQALAQDPELAPAHSNRGNLLAAMGQPEEAVAAYQRALEIDPDYAQAHYNLGNTHYRRGSLDEAISHYREALRIDPLYAEAHGNLGTALAGQGKAEEAMHHYRRMLEIDPDSAEAHYNLGNVLASQGKLDQGVAHYQEALRLDPDHAGALRNLCQAWMMQGKPNVALTYLRGAVQARPEFASAHYYLGQLLASGGQFDAALAHLAETARLQPHAAEPLDAMASVHLANPESDEADVEEAVRLAERACALSEHRNPQHLSTLAKAYARAGRYDRAVATVESAISLASAQQAHDLARDLRERLALYRQGKAKP